MDAALRRKNVLGYPVKIIRSYLSDRSIIVDGKIKQVTYGVPQGSVMGPALWNLFYDELLEIQMSPGVRLIAYADDVGVIAIPTQY